ncbi:hypothetical protein JOE53_002483 [Microbacterium laevaniformans]|uniref:Uncharacterized protein n=1 Tax=Microbacterium laevaniformans TaxID=36807 RepID=A0A150HAZ8_9MICO|nr:hypothetical protein [Microbacterium laevaniformans]KXZ59266.1 hypothetical protein Mlaev_02302 [Microbacterium laevaniformans]MBM7753763.1 hypothetical protein [Microbacterium laevaniformans]
MVGHRDHRRHGCLVATTYTDGEVVGTITWTAGPNTTTADVVVSGDIEPPTEWWRLTHPGQLGGQASAGE